MKAYTDQELSFFENQINQISSSLNSIESELMENDEQSFEFIGELRDDLRSLHRCLHEYEEEEEDEDEE